MAASDVTNFWKYVFFSQTTKDIGMKFDIQVVFGADGFKLQRFGLNFK